MGLELIIFIASILYGIFMYWRESNSNKLYRFFNKIFNNKELQMQPSDRKGFIFQQSFLPRLVFIAGSLLLVAIILQFLTPFKVFASYNGVSAFASIIVGTLIGTYIANFVIKSGDVLEEKSDSLSDMVGDAVEKGKDLIDDLKTKTEASIDHVEDKIDDVKEDIKEDAKTARERLKDKGLM